jgi:hypothetical protein
MTGVAPRPRPARMSQMSTPDNSTASVDLLWLPLGAGEPLGIVRRSGRIFEAIQAHHQHRRRYDLHHGHPGRLRYLRETQGRDKERASPASRSSGHGGRGFG